MKGSYHEYGQPLEKREPGEIKGI